MEQQNHGLFWERSGEDGKWDIKALVSWDQYGITIASSVFKSVLKSQWTRYCKIFASPFPQTESWVCFFFIFFYFFKLLRCETDFSVYLAVFTCKMTKSGLGGYLMGYGNVAHALESLMLKVMCVVLPCCQLSWRSSECIRFSIKAHKLIQTQRKVMMSWHDVIMFMELSYWRSKLKINTDCTLGLPDVAASGLYSEIWRRRRITAPCYSFAHSYNHQIHAEWLTQWINTLAPWRFAETNVWQTSPLLFARSGTVWEKPSNNRRTYWTIRAARIHICALLKTRDTDSFKAHTCVCSLLYNNCSPMN